MRGLINTDTCSVCIISEFIHESFRFLPHDSLWHDEMSYPASPFPPPSQPFAPGDLARNMIYNRMTCLRSTGLPRRVNRSYCDAPLSRCVALTATSQLKEGIAFAPLCLPSALLTRILSLHNGTANSYGMYGWINKTQMSFHCDQQPPTRPPVNWAALLQTENR